jgi:hypothetical protein
LGVLSERCALKAEKPLYVLDLTEMLSGMADAEEAQYLNAARAVDWVNVFEERQRDDDSSVFSTKAIRVLLHGVADGLRVFKHGIEREADTRDLFPVEPGPKRWVPGFRHRQSGGPVIARKEGWLLNEKAMDDLVLRPVGVPEGEHHVVSVVFRLPVKLFFGQAFAEQAGIPVPKVKVLTKMIPYAHSHLPEDVPIVRQPRSPVKVK